MYCLDNVFCFYFVIMPDFVELARKIVVRVSKDTGIIAVVSGTPFVVFVERGEPVNVYVDCMFNLYRQVNNPSVSVLKAAPDLKEKTAKAFFDKLATQVYADEKWKYLYSNRSPG